jgi:POT family proton-dependent oligopeptide transporter
MDKRLFGFLDGMPAFLSQGGLIVLGLGMGWIVWWLMVRVIPFVVDLIHGGQDPEEATPTVRAVALAAGAAFCVWMILTCWTMLPRLATYQMLPSQVQVVNGLFILILVPIFTFGIYPAMNRFFRVTPLRKIGIGLFTVASSFVVVAWIEQRIQEGHVVSIWWQIFAYVILTAAEVLVSITALEYSYKQAPLRMKSFVMALFLLSTSLGNAFTAAVNTFMVKPIEATAVATGDATWVTLTDVDGYVTGQKIDFDGDNGVSVKTANGEAPLAGTYLIREIDAGAKRVQLMDKVDRAPIVSSGTYDLAKGGVSTYTLVGPMYFLFFTALMCAGAVLYIFVAMRFRENTFVREDAPAAA